MVKARTKIASKNIAVVVAVLVALSAATEADSRAVRERAGEAAQAIPCSTVD